MYIPILPLLKFDFASWTGWMQKFFQHLMGVGLSMYLGVVFDIEAIYVDLTHVASRTEIDVRRKILFSDYVDYHLSYDLTFRIVQNICTLIVLTFVLLCCHSYSWILPFFAQQSPFVALPRRLAVWARPQSSRAVHSTCLLTQHVAFLSSAVQTTVSLCIINVSHYTDIWFMQKVF